MVFRRCTTKKKKKKTDKRKREKNTQKPMCINTQNTIIFIANEGVLLFDINKLMTYKKKKSLLLICLLFEYNDTLKKTKP